MLVRSEDDAVPRPVPGQAVDVLRGGGGRRGRRPRRPAPRSRRSPHRQDAGARRRHRRGGPPRRPSRRRTRLARSCSRHDRADVGQVGQVGQRRRPGRRRRRGALAGDRLRGQAEHGRAQGGRAAPAAAARARRGGPSSGDQRQRRLAPLGGPVRWRPSTTTRPARRDPAPGSARRAAGGRQAGVRSGPVAPRTAATVVDQAVELRRPGIAVVGPRRRRRGVRRRRDCRPVGPGPLPATWSKLQPLRPCGPRPGPAVGRAAAAASGPPRTSWESAASRVRRHRRRAVLARMSSLTAPAGRWVASTRWIPEAAPPSGDVHQRAEEVGQLGGEGGELVHHDDQTGGPSPRSRRSPTPAARSRASRSRTSARRPISSRSPEAGVEIGHHAGHVGQAGAGVEGAAALVVDEDEGHGRRRVPGGQSACTQVRRSSLLPAPVVPATRAWGPSATRSTATTPSGRPRAARRRRRRPVRSLARRRRRGAGPGGPDRAAWCARPVRVGPPGGRPRRSARPGRGRPTNGRTSTAGRSWPGAVSTGRRRGDQANTARQRSVSGVGSVRDLDPAAGAGASRNRPGAGRRRRRGGGASGGRSMPPPAAPMRPRSLGPHRRNAERTSTRATASAQGDGPTMPEVVPVSQRDRGRAAGLVVDPAHGERGRCLGPRPGPARGPGPDGPGPTPRRGRGDAAAGGPPPPGSW